MASPQMTALFDFDKRAIRHNEKVTLTEDGAGGRSIRREGHRGGLL
jgi:hypothetical protein